MKIKSSILTLHLAFLVIFLWGVIGRIIPNLQFVFLVIILILNIKKAQKYITKNFFIICLVLLVHGVINISVENDNILSFIIQYVSIIVSYLAFSSVIDGYSSKRIFTVYWKAAFVMSVIGILEIVLSIANISITEIFPYLFVNHFYEDKIIWRIPRIASICNEPSFLGYFLAPAMFLILYSVFEKENHYIEFDGKIKKIEAFCIFLVYLMTFSTVAYMGIVIAFSLIFMQQKKLLKKVALPFISVACMISLYVSVPDFKMRIDDTYNAFFSDYFDSRNINLSTFTYYANSRVAIKSVAETYGCGSGLGSYKYQFDKFNIGSWNNSNLNLNREDGNSMLYRIPVELGLPGLFVVFLFLYFCFPKFSKTKKIYAMSILTLLIMTMIRMGNYTYGGIWLYIALYLKLYREDKREINENLRKIK